MAARSQLRRMLLHLIKQKMQPERDGSSWRGSILDAQEEILDELEDSPSLRRYLEENLQRTYTRAVRVAAADEMHLTKSQAAEIPAECPYTLADLLEGSPQPWR